jgi:hypothetical protein
VDRNQVSQITAGALLVALGLVFLGQRLDVISGFDVAQLWPLILIFVGAGKFFGPRADGQPRGGLWMMFLGGLFLAHTFRIMTLDRSWPLFIVAGGVSIALGSRGKACGPKPSAGAPPNTLQGH